MRANSIHELELKVKICDETNWLNRNPVEAILGTPLDNLINVGLEEILDYLGDFLEMNKEIIISFTNPFQIKSIRVSAIDGVLTGFQLTFIS